MKQLLGLPKMIKDTRDMSSGKNLFIEIVSFLAIILVASTAEGFISIPFVMYASMTNPEFIKASVETDYTKIAELSTVLTNDPIMTIASLFATLGLIITPILFCKYLQKRKMSTLGFIKKNALKEYSIGLAIGLFMLCITVLPCLLTGALKLQSGLDNLSIGFIIAVFFGYLIQGMSEEVLCRGYFLVSVARKYSVVIAIMANSIIFAALHLMNNHISVLAFINLLLFGIFMSVYFLKRGSIWGVAAIHSMWNFAQGNIFGISVSGTVTHYSFLKATSPSSLSFLNGGEFGLEGGICTTVVLIAGILIILYKVKQVDGCVAEEISSQEVI